MSKSVELIGNDVDDLIGSDELIGSNELIGSDELIS